MALLFALAGMVLILIGQIDFTLGKVDVGAIVANAGAYLILVGLLNWLFEVYFKVTTIREISEITIGNVQIFNLGIEGCHEDSKDLSFTERIATARDIEIAFNYNSRFLDDYGDRILEAVKSGANFTQTYLAKDSSFVAAMISNGWDNASLTAAYNKINAFVSSVPEKSKKKVKTVFSKTMLKYSVVRLDSELYLILSTSSFGKTQVPALKVKTHSKLGKFVVADLRKVKAQANG